MDNPRIAKCRLSMSFILIVITVVFIFMNPSSYSAVIFLMIYCLNDLERFITLYYNVMETGEHQIDDDN